MHVFEIESDAGVVLARYPFPSEQEALDAHARAAGYRGFADLESRGPGGAYGVTVRVLPHGPETLKVRVEVDGRTYEGKYTYWASAVDDLDRVEISAQNPEGRLVKAGTGRWRNGRIEDCPADLGEDVYEALERALEDAIAGLG